MTLAGAVRLALACAAITTPPAAAGAETFLTREQLLAGFFPASERVTFKKLRPSAAQAEALRSRLGYAPGRQEWVIYVALTGDHVDGYAVIDDEPGQHEPITFGVKLSPEGTVERQEVLVYREKYGGEITDPRFRAQFTGKTGKDELRAGRDVDVITGATISSRAMAAGVRRAIAVVEELILRPASATQPLAGKGGG